MKKFITGIGQSDFRSLRESGANFVDKSSFISQVLADPSLVLLLPRPRRFGKTTNMSMLEHFLRKSPDDLTHLYKDLEVARDEHAMKHYQRYPVVTVSFKDAKGKTFGTAMRAIRDHILASIDDHRDVIANDKTNSNAIQKLRCVMAEDAIDNLPNSFKWLCKALHEYHKQRVVLLIDEYDTPLHNAYIEGYYDEMVAFYKTFLSACLKDNSSLFKGVLTGIMRIAKENMFSDLNHIRVRSILDKPFAKCFGFTEDEVANIIEPDELEAVRAWFNGYLFGGHVIYNPWSILNYVDDRILQPYWVNTASTDLIERLALKQGLGLSEQSEKLLNGGTIDTIVDAKIVLRNIESEPDAFWNFLLFAGYLKPLQIEVIDGDYHAKLAIPNQEVKHVYRNLFKKWLSHADPRYGYTDAFVEALLSGNATNAQEMLEHILLTAISFYDPGTFEPEKLYHGFILGLLVHLEGRYEIRSNRESGLGRADVLMRPKAPTSGPGVVMEFKVHDRKKTTDDVLKDAALQVRKKHYATELRTSGVELVYEYVMVFDGKQAWVKRVDELLG